MARALDAVPPAQAGSVRYFVLLYTQRERRAALSTLLAVADELEAGLARRLDHGIAHVRLEWWRQEGARAAAGAPTHPWLLELQRSGAPALALGPLVDAASIDLAGAFLAGQPGRQLGRARFLSAAHLLVPSGLSASDEQRIADLGEWVEAVAASTADAAASACPPVVSASHQPPLAPLLVWVALAGASARRHLRRARRESSTMAAFALEGLADNLLAWRAARRAVQGRIRIDSGKS